MCGIRYVSELLALVKMSHFTAKINGYFISLMPTYYHYQMAPLSYRLMTPTELHALLTANFKILLPPSLQHQLL